MPVLVPVKVHRNRGSGRRYSCISSCESSQEQGPGRRPPPASKPTQLLRCRAISASTTPAATAAFSDSAWPAIGMETTSSQFCRTRRDKPFAFRTDNDHHRVVAVQVVQHRVATRVQSDHAQPAISPILQRSSEIGGPRHRDPGRGASAGSPRDGRHRGGSALRYHHAVTTQRRHRPHDRAEVARVGDVVQSDQQRRRSFQGAATRSSGWA